MRFIQQSDNSLWIGTLAFALVLAVPTRGQADLRLHVEGSAAAPLDEYLRSEGAGYSISGSLDYEVVNLLAVGLFYSFTDFISDKPFIFYDHTAGVRLDLRFVRHRTAGWFGHDNGNAYGEAFLELDLQYHYLGEASRIGWGLGLGYRVIVSGPFGLGPFFRFRHIVPSFDENSSEMGHQFYGTFGLEFFFSFDLTGEEEEAIEVEEESPAEAEMDDEWDEFESADSQE